MLSTPCFCLKCSQFHYTIGSGGKVFHDILTNITLTKTTFKVEITRVTWHRAQEKQRIG